LFVDLKARGLPAAPGNAVGDGALGFWKALDEIFPTTRHQRCWVHKIANILNKVPKSVQPGMKEDLREVRDAPDRATAEAAIGIFAEKYATKYPKAVECYRGDNAPEPWRVFRPGQKRGVHGRIKRELRRRSAIGGKHTPRTALCGGHDVALVGAS
jgi:hypothetical protein